MGREPLRRRRIARLGRLAQREQRFVTSERGTLPGDLEHVVERQERVLEVGRRLRERAVATAVAAQHGQRDEDLRREGDAVAVRVVTDARRLTRQLGNGHVEQVQQIGREHGPQASCGRVSAHGVPAAAGSTSQITRAACTRARRDVITGTHTGEGVGLLRAGDGEDDEACVGERGKGEREARVRMLIVGIDHHEVVILREGGRAREQRGGVTVGPEAQVHEVDRRCARARGARRRSRRLRGVAGTAHRVDRVRLDLVEERVPGHALVRLRVVDGDPALVPEVRLDRSPLHVGHRQQLVAVPSGVAARERDRARRLGGHQLREGLGNVFDHPHFAVHATHLLMRR